MTLLELGVSQGASVRTWAEYFTHPQAQIVGIDNDLSRLESPMPEKSALYVCDQAQVPVPWTQGRPDIIIDDASHLSSKTIASFVVWFPLLAPGGIYAVEDVFCSYIWGPDESNIDPDKSPPLRPGGQTTMQFLRRLADEVNASTWCFTMPAAYRLGYDIASLCFHPNLVIIRKKGVSVS